MNAMESAFQSIHEIRKRAISGDKQAVADLRDIALRAIATLEDLRTMAGHPELPVEHSEAGKLVAEVAAESRCWPVKWDAIQEVRETELGVVVKDKKQDGTGRVGRLGIGEKLGIRIHKKAGQKKPRDFTPQGPAFFGLAIWEEIEAVRKNPAGHLHDTDAHPELAAPGVLTEDQLKRSWRNLAAVVRPLSGESLEAWVEAGAALCREWVTSIEIDPQTLHVRRVPIWENFPWNDAIQRKAAEIANPRLSAKRRGVKASIRGKIRAALTSLLP